MYVCMYVCMYVYIYIYIYIYIHVYVCRCCCRRRLRPQPRSSLFVVITVSFRNFKSQNFKLSVWNPKNKYVAYLSVRSQISNCQSLGRKNKHEILKTDRMHLVIICAMCIVLLVYIIIVIVMSYVYVRCCISICYNIMDFSRCMYMYVCMYIYIYIYIYILVFFPRSFVLRAARGPRRAGGWPPAACNYYYYYLLFMFIYFHLSLFICI